MPSQHRTTKRKASDTEIREAEKSGKRRLSNILSKVDSYSNSKLPLDLPHLKLSLRTHRLVCLAAKYSNQAYDKPLQGERETHVEADILGGTKAMVIKSMPLDSSNTIILAIRGTVASSVIDWVVNATTRTTSPQGFLDDPTNKCHTGFLNVTRKMVRPVASRLRALLEENSARKSCSLVITGHSAGGAVASLLFAHIMSSSIVSELTEVAACFKRIHCITFGSPPVSQKALTKSPNARFKKSSFLSFINEGDPISRAQWTYVGNYLKLLMSSASKANKATPALPLGDERCERKGLDLARELVTISDEWLMPNATWKVPKCKYAVAGKIVVLRRAAGVDGDVTAVTTTDDGLRGVVFGKLEVHKMDMYRKSVEDLGLKALKGDGHYKRKRIH